MPISSYLLHGYTASGMEFSTVFTSEDKKMVVCRFRRKGQSRLTPVNSMARIVIRSVAVFQPGDWE